MLNLDFEDVPNEGGGQATGVTIVNGHDNLGILIDENDTLIYQTEGHINNKKGSIEFWFQPNWAGGDGLDHTFFDVGIALYVDAQLQEKESGVPMPARLASQLYIGSTSDGRNQANAVIDQFRIYSSAK